MKKLLLLASVFVGLAYPADMKLCLLGLKGDKSLKILIDDKRTPPTCIFKEPIQVPFVSLRDTLTQTILDDTFSPSEALKITIDSFNWKVWCDEFNFNYVLEKHPLVSRDECKMQSIKINKNVLRAILSIQRVDDQMIFEIKESSKN